MRYAGIEILNNDVTPMEHVVALLEAAFGYDHDYAFELMLRIHKEQRGSVAVFEHGYLSDFVTRFSELNRRLSKPVQYLVIDDIEEKSAPFIVGADILARDPPEFPPPEVDWEKYVTTATLVIIFVSVALLVYFQRH